MAKPYAHIVELARLLSEARQEKGFSYNDLAAVSRVDAAQSYRICKGRFRRLNQSVLQICKALEVDPPGEVFARLPAGPPNQLITLELSAAWARISEGADKLAQVLRALRE